MRVSTIIPAFNAERTIAQAIESALAQRYDRHEIVVVNDGSTDATAGILERYRGRLRIVNQENRGASAARNAGIAHSNGEYLAFLDSDDLFLPEKLAVMTAALARHPGASLAFSEYGFIDDSGNEYRQSAICDASSMAALMNKCPFPVASLSAFIYPSTWLVPRKHLLRTGGFSEAFKGAGYEDSWLLLLLRDLGEFVHVPDKLTLYRETDAAAVADKYGPGLSVFIDMVRKRYGKQGRDLVRGTRNAHCRALLSKIAHQMDRGDRAGAIHSLLHIAKTRPAYFFSSECLTRLRFPQNRRRVRGLATVPARARE
jgi:glycosyltransferase involved in cell wall biosynthesis